ncbi:hypothetical protein AURDEDRAFT_166981 [Auricularia subglabra TFB-10046 SS5]|nr:hypothetical protein AURDEDRAFT_166981 [Auricularia subglabra TFB-10046 SS5]
MSVLATSRSGWFHSSTLRCWFLTPVETEGVGVSRDVELLMDHALQHGALRTIGEELQSMVRDRLLANKGASILWVRLQLDALSEHAGAPAKLKAYLHDMPLDLRGTYERRLSDLKHVRRVLVWMAKDAMDPISTTALTQMLNCNSNDPMHPIFHGKRSPPKVEDAIAFLGTAFAAQTTSGNTRVLEKNRGNRRINAGTAKLLREPVISASKPVN